MILDEKMFGSGMKKGRIRNTAGSVTCVKLQVNVCPAWATLAAGIVTSVCPATTEILEMASAR
jgi:hypothetical protein